MDAITTTPKETEMTGFDTTTSDQAQAQWDSESRKSAYSTVCDASDDTYCEACDSEVTHSGPDDKHGTCNCEGI